MAAISEVQAAAQQLQEENRRIKARTNDQDERLKRLATQVKKEEELLATKSKKAGVRTDQVKDIAQQDAKIKRLQQQVREKEKQNTALARHIAVYRHSFPQQQQKGPAARRPHHFPSPHTDCELRQTLRAWVRARDPRVRNALRRARWRLDALPSGHANAPGPQNWRTRARRLQT